MIKGTLTCKSSIVGSHDPYHPGLYGYMTNLLICLILVARGVVVMAAADWLD